jgi:hypothetical protein
VLKLVKVYLCLQEIIVKNYAEWKKLVALLNCISFAGLQVLITMTMKVTTFWVVTPTPQRDASLPSLTWRGKPGKMHAANKI